MAFKEKQHTFKEGNHKTRVEKANKGTKIKFSDVNNVTLLRNGGLLFQVPEAK